jgi:hypothetical protein
LEAYINNLGLSVNDKRSILNTDPSLNEGKRLANVKLQEKQGRNQKIQNRKNLEAYINSLGLTTNDKVNILNKDPNLTEGKRLANNRVQMKIREKRNKNKTALSIYLNKLGLKNTEKNQFLTNLNNPNVNINAIKQRANIFVQNKKAQKQRANREEFEEYLMQLNLTNAERLEFINMITQTNNTNVTSLKKKANAYLAERIKIRRATIRQELAAYLQGLNITNKDKTNIMREFNNTNTNIQVLKNRANGILGARKQQRFIEEEGEFMNYLNTLTNLTANNKTQITSKLNSYFTDWESLKKSATNLALQRASEKRNKQRTELENYATELGLNNTRKRALLKQLDNKVSNLSTLKREAKEMKNAMNEEARSEKRKNLLRQLTQFNITNENRSELMKQFGTTNNSSIINQAKNLESNRRATKRDELSLFMTELGLEQTDRNLILKNFDANPKNTTLRNKATQLKQTRNKEDREKIRRELKEYLNTLNMLNNSNKQKLLANNTRSYNNVKNEANQLQAQKKVISERKKEREELARYINTLNLLNKNNKQKLLANNSRNNSNVRAEANQLQANKKAQIERKKQREELVRYMNTLNMLNNANKQKLLANNSKNIANIRTEANKLQEFKKTAKRASELNTLKKSMNGLNQNSQLYVIDKFETQNVTLNSMLKEVEQLKKKMAAEKRSQNREELVDYMNGLSIGDNDKKKILKNYDSQKANFGTLKNRATQINTAIKNKERQRQELSNYINELGINGAQLLQKFNDGRSTLNRLKADADKMKTVANARLVNSKRNQLRTHMKNTRLNDTTKKSFINRVNVNTNMNSLKGEVNNLNTQLKTRDEALAAKKSELSVFLNTLNDLRPENRKTFLAKVVNANTNTEAIKRNATTMNKAVKNRRVEKERQEEEERKKEEKRAREVDRQRLEQHLKSLKHLTSAEMADYMSSFERNGAKIEDVIATSKAKDKDNEKDKDTLRFYIRNAQIPQAKKDLYLRQLLQPHVNITPIKRLVNVNKERERLVGEQLKAQVTKKLKTLKAITANNRAKFLNNLKTKPPNEVLAAAEKLDSERRGVRDKGIKNVAGELSKLTNLERNNRKKLMNRLATNGPEKVLANAKKLNQERKDVRKREEEKKARNAGTKKLATNLQGLTSLTRDNRKKLMNRLPTNGAQKVLANAQALNKQRKNAVEKTRQEAEAKKKAEVEAKRKAEEEKKARNTGTKKLATNLQALTSLTRENRKKLMNRLPTNGAQKVLANAKKLNQERKTAAKQKEERNKRNTESVGKADLIRKGVEDKFRRINGLTKQNVKDFMEKWDKTKNKKLFDEARKLGAKKAEENNNAAAEASRLFNAGGNVKNLSRGKNERGVDKELLEAVRKFVGFGIGGKRREAFLARGRGMSSTKPLIKEIQERKLLRNKVVADLQRRNDGKMRAQYIDLLEDGSKVWTNVKQTIERGFKRRTQEMEQKEAQKRRTEEQKKREEEKAKKMKAGKAKGDVAGALQNMKYLNRTNRKEFMARLNRGVDPGIILRNARKRSTEKGLAASKPTTSAAFLNNSKFETTGNPLFKKAGKQVVQNIRMKTMTNAVKKAAETERKQQELSKLKGPPRVAASRNLGSKQGRDRGQTAEGVKKIFSTGQSEDERRRLAMLEKQKKKDAKAALRKQNKQLARATGQGVKATQKKQQALRRKK